MPDKDAATLTKLLLVTIITVTIGAFAEWGIGIGFLVLGGISFLLMLLYFWAAITSGDKQ